MVFNIIRILYFAVFLVLLLISFSLVFNGPILQFFEGKTEFVEKLISKDDMEKPIKWPSVVICKNPSIKSKETWHDLASRGATGNFSSQAQLTKMLEDIYYTHPEEIVIDLRISRNYETLMSKAKKIPRQEPYITNVLADLSYFGYCSVISLEALKIHMKSEGEIPNEEIDSPFALAVWIQVEFKLLYVVILIWKASFHLKKGGSSSTERYLMKLIPDQETYELFSPNSGHHEVQGGYLEYWTMKINMKNS